MNDRITSQALYCRIRLELDSGFRQCCIYYSITRMTPLSTIQCRSVRQYGACLLILKVKVMGIMDIMVRSENSTLCAKCLVYVWSHT